MGNDKRRDILHLEDALPEQVFRLDVQSAGEVIEKEQVGLPDEHP